MCHAFVCSTRQAVLLAHAYPAFSWWDQSLNAQTLADEFNLMARRLVMATFISNNSNTDHEDALKKMFKGAQRFDWHIAFASEGGVGAVRNELDAFLKAGHAARVIVGLDYFHTEPGALDIFYGFSQKYSGQVKFYISAPGRQWIFHPKIYVFHCASEEERSARVLVGSANLTAGGLGGNHELSARLFFKFDKDGENTFINDFELHVRGIIDSKEVVQATKDLIEDYRRKHLFYKLHGDIARRRAARAIERAAEDPYEYYRAILEEYRKESEPDDFDSQVQRRLKNRASALGVLQGIRRQGRWRKDQFLEQYRLLVSPPCHYFYSGLINMGQEKVANSRQNFVAGLAALEVILRRGPVTPAQAYDALVSHFSSVSGAGVNVITEILHAYDNNSYAVMNKLSVSQLCRVSGMTLPVLNKTAVTGDIYEAFCMEAKRVCKALGLKNFTEFDALMSYDYWS